MIVRYSEFLYWSVVHDAEVARVSVPDEHGREFFAIVECSDRGYRDRRAEAIEKIVSAIEAGCEPGEVRWRQGTKPSGN